MSLHGLFFILDCLSLSDDNFLLSFDDSYSWIKTSNKTLNFIFYSSFSSLIFWFILNLSNITYHKRCWIHVSSLKTEWKRILSHRNEIATKIMENCWEFGNNTSSTISFNFFQLSFVHNVIVSHWILLMFMILRIRTVHSNMIFL